jgi:hypothetical protein
MDSFAGLHAAVGKPQNAVRPPAARLEDASVDEELRLLWEEDGWASYGNGLLWTLDPQEFAELRKDWPAVPGGATAFARNAFGDVFLLKDGEVLHLDVRWNRIGELGPSVYTFLNSTLGEKSLRESYLQPGLFAKVRERVGELAADECYGLVPALPAGGNDEDPKAYQRVKLREYLALTAQAHG